MIIYEITVTVSEQLIKAYEKYMREQHIPDLLATGYFVRAYFTRSGGNRYRIQYYAENIRALDEYLKKEASHLREDFAVNFPEGIEVSRENWNVLEIYSS